MKIKQEYSLFYDLDMIYVVRTKPDGSKEEICPISETAAMAWEGIDKGIDRKSMIDAIVTEFSGAEEAQVAADLDMLVSQLVSLGYAEE